MITFPTFPILSYLEQRLPSYFDQASQSEYRGRCLFHDERNPSFYVNVETGNFFCHSCHAKGDVIKLVQRIGQFTTRYDAMGWLQTYYGVDADRDTFELHFNERIDCGEPDYADHSLAMQYVGIDDSYMLSRGIPVETLRQFNVGFDAQSNSVTLPWYTRHGQLLTVKHRAISIKKFWYSPRCPLLRHYVWGLQRCKGADVVYVVEAEIDAMTLWAAGKQSVALGGSHMSVEQARALVLSGIQTVVLTFDRDKAGYDANRLARERLSLYDIDTVDAIWPDGFNGKDCNELGVENCKKITFKPCEIYL